MAVVARAVASLRIMGDLSPTEITSLLGCEPSTSQVRGELLVGKSGVSRTAKFGAWRLKATATVPADLDAQVLEILGKLTSDLAVWQSLGKRFHIDLFCGWFMDRKNEGTTVLPGTLLALGERGIELCLDIYEGDNELPSS